MINDQAIDLVKSHLKDYLEEQGINTKKPFRCLNPQHEDKNPSMSYDKKRNIVKCFSCNTSYDIISLYAIQHGLDNNNDFTKVVENLALKYNIDIKKKARAYQEQNPNKSEQKKEDFTRYYKKCEKGINKTDYLLKRGLSEDIIKKYKIGYDEAKQMVILPISKYCYEGRGTTEQSIKHFKPKGVANELFNNKYLKDSNFKTIIWVTEAIIDALSLEEAKKDIKALSLNSANNYKQLVQEAKDNNYKGTFILALDTDYDGIKTSKALKEELDLIGIKTVIFNSNNESYNVRTETNDFIENKDINEMLLTGKDRLIKNVNYYDDTLLSVLEKEALQLYEKESISNYLDTFTSDIQDKEKNKPLSTGITPLDDALEGGFYKKNLVILGAISSLGKTTLALQIGDNIAKQGNDVLIFSLEMSKEELIAKSLSRETFLIAKDQHYIAHALTTREILKGKGIDTDIPNNEDYIEIYQEAFKNYKDTVASHLYITECNDEIDINIQTINDKIKRHIAITNSKPFVIIDYLQIIQNQEKGLTDKQVIDRIVTSLKRIARENDITILLISAFNRASYNQESNLASFRDSSTIEYTSDVLLSLQPSVLDGVNDDSKKVNVNEIQQRTERPLTLKVLKNRNGRITDVNDITFYAKYNYMDFNTNSF